ncbi:hypothetical protein [Nonomuraea sp. NPDC049607]|uniref:hypothetical protein n=1 Tax=Nonomuraea sp. NPDC049607 TaxID=3154732 RepID=UPI00343D3C3C
MTQTIQGFSVQAKCLDQDGKPWHLPKGDDTAEKGERVTLHITARLLNSSQPSTDLAMIECEILSGFTPVTDSLDALVAGGLVTLYDIDETDQLNQRLDLYLKEVGSTPTEIAFQIECKHAVHDLEPSTIELSDSYDPDSSVSTMYPRVKE